MYADDFASFERVVIGEAIVFDCGIHGLFGLMSLFIGFLVIVFASGVFDCVGFRFHGWVVLLAACRNALKRVHSLKWRKLRHLRARALGLRAGFSSISQWMRPVFSSL